MAAASVACEQPNAGQALSVQIDVESFIALISLVAKHAELAPLHEQTSKARASANEHLTALTGEAASDRSPFRPATASQGGVRHVPEVSLVNMLIDALAPTTGSGGADIVPLRSPTNTRIYPFGKTWLNVEAAKLVDSEGNEVPLTAMEYRLLKLFAENRGRVLNRDQILEGAHDRSWDPFDRSIDIRISRIRKKIERNPQRPEAIRTVRGIGYVYDPA
ncbi:winged helix-turn-helix domain-containing protein [Defluviimonas sp. WL0024]|uniref:Winged helix-turn-helix domain-containing protein n=2 Tax=Albidovulum TaxID=205889 RepID=A0ABT3J6X3_9RHOB|nr:MULTISPECIES: winged helix-turn-helix domain-containing protein [Defluviimonas]MCU9850107.1 winged helix-turn-helix domain-containing protein [Defluviimonas sp. WL0024]MCW3783418.1 winged helix-turn-helix domain-containing protein [Defluviimonas salinarum]